MIVKINKSKIISTIALIVIALIINSINFDIIIDDYQKFIRIISWVTTAFYAIFIMIIYKIKKNILDYNIVFLSFIFLFCFGQIFLFGLGVPTTKLYLFSWFGNELVFKASLYFLSFSIFYMIGVYLSLNYNDSVKEFYNDNNLKSSVKILALFLLIISIIPYFYIFLPTLYNSIVYGYTYNFNNAVEVAGFSGYLSKFFLPSLFLLLYSYKNDKIRFRIILTTLLLLSILYLIRGSKGSGITIIVSLVVFYSNFIKRINGFSIIKIVPVLLIVILIIPIITNYRETEDKNIAGFSESINETFHSPDNLFVKAISEMGGSMQAFIYTYKIIPSNYNYGYGKSYSSSIMMVIPSFLIGSSIFAENAALDIWLMKTCHLSFGPGYSIVAEVYYNFGWYGGLFFTIFLGMFFTKIFQLTSNNKTKNELLKLLSFIFLFNSMTKARFPFHETIRNVFYMYFVFYYIIMIIYNQRIKRTKDINYEKNN